MFDIRYNEKLNQYKVVLRITKKLFNVGRGYLINF